MITVTVDIKSQTMSMLHVLFYWAESIDSSFSAHDKTAKGAMVCKIYWSSSRRNSSLYKALRYQGSFSIIFCGCKICIWKVWL